MQYARCRRILDAGMPIGWRVRGQLGLELRLTALGGRRILDRLEAGLDRPYDRPRLRTRDWLRLAAGALGVVLPKVKGTEGVFQDE